MLLMLLVLVCCGGANGWPQQKGRHGEREALLSSIPLQFPNMSGQDEDPDSHRLQAKSIHVFLFGLSIVSRDPSISRCFSPESQLFQTFAQHRHNRSLLPPSFTSLSSTSTQGILKIS